MSIVNFKNIEDRKGYLVESDDRKIFEKEIGKAFFGEGMGDMIEFILYDSSDNQLPQGDSAKMVRYISLNDANINEYFLLSDSKNGKKLNDASEFVVDIEKLIREAGYSNGIFKTQVTLLNKRVGVENSTDEKLWIHEISPSRTEIRVLPIKNKGNIQPELSQRYATFTQDRNFRDDTIYFAKSFIEQIDVQLALENFLKSKGRVSDGKNYIELIKQEFKVTNFEKLLVDIKQKFVESMNYFIDGYEWSISSNRYGKRKPAEDLIELSVNTIESIALQSLITIIDYFLPRRDIQEKSILTKEQQRTIDELKQILLSNVSTSIYQSTTPESITAQVRGCTDPTAENYNPSAEIEDGTCKYKQQTIDNNPIESDPKEEDVDATIPGCMDKEALNYNPRANKENGTCTYREIVDDDFDVIIPPKLETKKFYVWSDYAKMSYLDINGTERKISGAEYDYLGQITCREGSKKITGDIRNVPKVRPPVKVIKEYRVQNLSKPTYETFYEPQAFTYEDDYYNHGVYDEYRGDLDFGGRGNYTDNYRYGYGGNDFERRRAGNDRIIGSSRQPLKRISSPGRTLTFSYTDEAGSRRNKSVNPNQTITVCAEVGSIQILPDLKITKLGNCGDAPQVIPVRPIEIQQDIPIITTPPALPRAPRTIPIRSGGGGGGRNLALFDQVETGNGQDRIFQRGRLGYEQ